MRAVARMQQAGIPIDTDTLALLQRHWPQLKQGTIAEIGGPFGVYEGTVFKEARFASGRKAQGSPAAHKGHLALDQDTFKDMAKLYPEVEPLRQLRHMQSDLRLQDFGKHIGSDGRNRPGRSFGPLWSTHPGKGVHLRAGCLDPRADKASAGPGDRLHRLLRAGGGDRGCAVRG